MGAINGILIGVYAVVQVSKVQDLGNFEIFTHDRVLWAF